jgi:hypothetical protein
VADSKDPLQQLLDVVVYAPIGLLTLAQKELPQLISTGRTRIDNQLTLAKFVGKMAVAKGRNSVEKRLAAAERARQHDVISSPLTRDTDADTVMGTDTDGATLPNVILDAVADELAHPHTDQPAPDSAELPIEGYDSLAASQVVLRLGSLTGTELDSVRRYETEHRNRRTILGKISQLQAK